ncbi:MAG: hypothetical protein IPN01_05290 [Deltaproteobacteria bacterium]|nr:hypothetical protein [Deltaproteobacteria bacterium]
MAEPFKEWFNPSVVAALGERQRQVDSTFPLDRFVREATDGLAAFELKGRVTHIAEALRRALPAEWPAAVDRLLAAAPTPSTVRRPWASMWRCGPCSMWSRSTASATRRGPWRPWGS